MNLGKEFVADNSRPSFEIGRKEIFRIPFLTPSLGISDVFTVPIGKSLFVIVTAICQNREKAGQTWIFRMSPVPPFHIDPEPLLTLPLFHPRNVAIGPEKNGARWIWIADHGPDHHPFSGGCAPLLRIHESGRVEVKQDPLLQINRFSFDGCLWENPATDDLYLYQSNIGPFSPRLFRWKKGKGRAEDISSRLPAGFLVRHERFLISRILRRDRKGVDIFFGADYSDVNAVPHERDMLLRIPFDGNAKRSPFRLPPRRKDRTWSTVEAALFKPRPGADISLLALYHDFGFRAGLAEVLRLRPGCRLRRTRSKLPLPPLEGTRTWIARAAVGDLDGDGRSDIVFYLRATEGMFRERSYNLIVLRQNSRGTFEHVACPAAGDGAHFVAGFFLNNELFQLRFDGVLEQTWFSF